MVADSRKVDKFLIRCAPVASTTTGDFTELFASVESLAKDHRLKCAIVGGEEAGATVLAGNAPVDTSSPNDGIIGGIVSPSQGQGSGLERSAFDRSTSSINNPGQVTPPQEPSPVSNDHEEQLQKELSKQDGS